MTAKLDLTPMTTEQNRIVRTGKSEAEVTDNKKLRSRYCTIEATDRHEASCGLFATAELLVLSCSPVLERDLAIGGMSVCPSHAG